MTRDGARIPVTVVALAMAQVLLSLSYALLTPAMQGPDEPQHIDMAVAVGEWEPWPIAGERTLAREVRVSMRWVGLHPRSEPRAADAAPDRSERPSLADLAGGKPTIATNHINQHPPLYYASLNAWVGFLVSASPVDLGAVDRTIFVMRSLGALLAGGVVVLIWLVAARAGLGERASLAAAAVPLMVPMFTYVHSAVNNDVVLPVLTAAVAWRLVGTLRGELDTRAAVLVGVLVGLTAWGKLFGLAAVPMVLLAVWWAPGAVRRRLQFLAVVLSVAFVSGGWWWLRNLLVEGTVQPMGFLEQEPLSEPDVAAFVEGLDVRLWQGFFGRFGVLNAPVERWVLVVLTGAFVAALVVFVGRARRRDAPLDDVLARRAITVAVLPFVAVLGVELTRVTYRFLAFGQMSGLQGRYTFLGMVGVALVVGVGVATAQRHAVWAQAGVIVLGQTAGAIALLRKYWGVPGGSVRTSLDGLAAWSPFAGRWTFGLCAAAAIAVLLALAALVRRSLALSDPRPAR